jgi:hypothetical protein
MLFTYLLDDLKAKRFHLLVKGHGVFKELCFKVFGLIDIVAIIDDGGVNLNALIEGARLNSKIILMYIR